MHYLNPTLFIVLMNNDDNPNLIEAMNSPDHVPCWFFWLLWKMETENLIEMKAFFVVGKESWMNVVSSI